MTTFMRTIRNWLSRIYVAKPLARVPDGAIVFFPIQPLVLSCGLAGIVAVKDKTGTQPALDVDHLTQTAGRLETNGLAACMAKGADPVAQYLAGAATIRQMLLAVRALKTHDLFCQLWQNADAQRVVTELAARLESLQRVEEAHLAEQAGHLLADVLEAVSARLEDLRDIVWCLKQELLENIERVKALLPDTDTPAPSTQLTIYKEINAVLNSIDRLEVRGRDSAGISMLFILDRDAFDQFKARLAPNTATGDNGWETFEKRCNQDILLNRSISQNDADGPDGPVTALTLTYKIAAEVGNLGDNIAFLRQQIQDDPVLQTVTGCRLRNHTVSSHTRWASVGAISEPNCHPHDNNAGGRPAGIIQACLNGDIDNFMDLKAALAKKDVRIPDEITSDTKIIPLQVEAYVREGHAVADAFRRAVNDFEGSHAIAMQTDLAPGKLFLAQKGSGQTIFIGLAPDHYMSTSEVYGFIEETDRFIKLDGEKVVNGQHGPTQGQIYVLDQQSAGGLTGIDSCYYDGTPNPLSDADIKSTEITSRDIDRQNFPHYFLKEICEAPLSVEKTLHNRWKITADADKRHEITLDEKTIPSTLRTALVEDRIRRVFVVGQGTAGVAAQACADIINYYLNDTRLHIGAMKASELSGFKINANANGDSMADCLVIAISQSGTTTDTNRTVDMVREHGAHTLAIVNRRDSDITFRVDGVLYTSSGRDIEMSVASTKAFYSQIVAGAVLGLFLAALKQRRSPEFISSEIKRLLALPNQMRTILGMREAIAQSAQTHAVTKTYWAAVGSGPNKTSADEIRIKLSELCYKTISSDYVEDKKHIDLSSEPLIIVCAAGTRSNVIGDVIKDTAIFRAHKATPIVIADEGQTRFDDYAADVFYVPPVEEHLAPIVNTLVGHIWGYYAALAINEGSRFLHDFRDDVKKTLDRYAADGLDIYEVLLEKTFREKIAQFYHRFRERKNRNGFPSAMGLEAISNMTLLLKYLAGRLPVGDFEIDFGKKGTALNMIQTFFDCLGDSINAMARPVDAIKHQAKTVTVGTSRISEKLEGILFDELAANRFEAAHLTPSNVIVLKNLQQIVASIQGSTLYELKGLNVLGEATDETTIDVLKKTGTNAAVPSRVESDNRLKGTKRIVVRQGNVYIGKGRRDGRSIIVIPLTSAASGMANVIENILLFHVAFHDDIPLAAKVKALGGKHEHIKNIVQENNIVWQDQFLELIATDELFGRSAEKVGEYICAQLGNGAPAAGSAS